MEMSKLWVSSLVQPLISYVSSPKHLNFNFICKWRYYLWGRRWGSWEDSRHCLQKQSIVPNTWENNGVIMTAAASSGWTPKVGSTFQDFSQWKGRNRKQDTTSSPRIPGVQNSPMWWWDGFPGEVGKTLQEWRGKQHGSEGVSSKRTSGRDWAGLGKGASYVCLCQQFKGSRDQTHFRRFFLKLPNKLFWLF